MHAEAGLSDFDVMGNFSGSPVILKALPCDIVLLASGQDKHLLSFAVNVL